MADSYRGHIPEGTADIAAGLTGDLTRPDSTTRSARQNSPLGDPEQDPLLDSNGVGKGDDESNILFVDGLPTDCTRREVSHLFRPFIGFKDIKVVHKEPRKRGDKGYVLCFVEFADAKCARTALEALNGYQFDAKKPGLGSITLHFAKFPFRPPGSSAAT